MRFHFFTAYCPNCGELFTLDEGMASQKWYPDFYMCEECLRSESWEMSYPDEQPKFPKKMPLVKNRTKNMVELDVPIYRPSFSIKYFYKK
jgi:hypothetical protein